jgi:hydrogenase maturation protein HypF
VHLLAADGQPLAVPDAIAEAARQLAAGAILAIKGLGGYHLACDALDNSAVRRLRQRKARQAKPFAVMVPDLATAQRLGKVQEEEAELLCSRRRPIVLLERHPDALIAAAVAPAYHSLGVMLPYTPLHYLLLDAFAQRVAATRPAVLVMTSGNVSDEPIAYEDAEAQRRLRLLVDGWLIHNRNIHIRCDDSVVRVVVGGQQLLRRARGYVPEPMRLPTPSPLPLLACGGHLKNSFCLAKAEHAFISHHIGDLENVETLTSFRAGISHFQRLFDISPQAVAYDLHPSYLATQYALALDLPEKIGVQHHHAHIASVLAEHELAGPVIGVAADGTGYGPDGAIWGCEVMVADLLTFTRMAHLAYVPLPGGEQAIRQPWRMAAAYLAQSFGEDFLALNLPFVQRLDRRRWRPLAQMITRNLNSPPTSSLGRLFDAVAALLGVQDEVAYEGQAAIELEMISSPATTAYPFVVQESEPWVLDVVPMIRAIVADLQSGAPAPLIAGRFHYTVAEMLATLCGRVRAQTGLKVVALSGGVFQNRLLLEQLSHRLAADDFQVYRNQRVPPNDGGISLGQAAVAAARLAQGRKQEGEQVS